MRRNRFWGGWFGASSAAVATGLFGGIFWPKAPTGITIPVSFAAVIMGFAIGIVVGMIWDE